ncbi:hypothetical protein GCM10011487_69170 [Steroidobacter agaridevorans]|uniref:Uncharacterized protein n=1 Tax=Steroidobacter agaridevorans TaxID=2695856 RepID=A0A829YNJ9_9GAMM|nr:hypothetical protein [Steroidobacter agaridevorans]GFE84917.1 hypothetical protein GCM10011487_69170 [Steroidobacter agaridevorans]
MDASTLVIAFLLVTAASLASYLLSQWNSIRNSNLSISWVVISIGVTLLLAAAAIVVLTVGLLSELRLSPNIESAEPRRQSTPWGRGTAERVVAPQAAPTTAAPAESDISPAAGRTIAEKHPEHRSEIARASALNSPQPSEAPAEAKAPHGAGLVFTEADPWAATNCVYALNRDPADLTRWTIENECGAPVGVVFASCSKSPLECSDRQSTSWEYPIEGMILPGRAQRPVTYEEETRYGSQIRYVACMVATPLAIELIGESREIRSSPSWVEQFDAARNGDECLTRVQKLSAAGRRSGGSIDALLGPNAPGKVRPGFVSEL